MKNSYDLLPRNYEKQLDEAPQALEKEYVMFFVTDDFMNRITVKKVKVNELFGIVGGAILFIFIGLGSFARSFNEFKMRFTIGSRLYKVMGQKRKPHRMKFKGKKIQSQNDDSETNYSSEIYLLWGWFSSFLAFLGGNYSCNKTLKYISLIQSHVHNDISVIQFYKKLQACQTSIKRMNLTADISLDLSKVYAKKVEPYGQEPMDVTLIDSELREVAKVNEFSDWELFAIM